MDVMTKCCEHCPTPRIRVSPTVSSVQRFLADETVHDPSAVVEQSALYSAYVRWCGSDRPIHMNRFGMALSHLGHETSRTSTKRYRVGLSLNSYDVSARA